MNRRINLELKPIGKNSRVWIDGVEQFDVAAVTVHTAVDEATRVSIDYVACDVEISADVEETFLDVSSFLDAHRKYRVNPHAEQCQVADADAH